MGGDSDKRDKGAFDDDVALSAPNWASAAAWSLPGTTAPDPAEDPAGPQGESARPPHPFELEEEARYPEGPLVGVGGMGRVTAVEDRRLRRQVALKEVAADNPGATEGESRLAQEAWITAQLEHPGIVPVYDAGRTAGGNLFYTMRLIRGRSLADALSEAGLLEDRLGLLRHFLDACEAVAYAHSVGVIHRDLKPANVMVGEFGETQVMDWGLARPADTPDPAPGEGAPDAPSGSASSSSAWARVLPEAHAAQTVFGAIVGTPSYMSPEQASGEVVDARTDVWSLGAILFELLTGEPPFTGPDTAKVLARLRAEPVPDLAEVAPQAPPELIAVTRRALARDAAGRYPDAKSLARDIERYLDGRRVSAYAYSPLDNLKRLARAWRAPIAVGLAALVVVIVVAVVGYVQTVSERDRARAAEAESTEALARADANLARALVEQAIVAEASDSRPEAELLAAHAVSLRESPDARGVLAAYAHLERPLLERRVALPTCREHALGPRGELLLCLGNTEVSLWELSPMRRRWTVATERPRGGWFFLEAGLVGVAQHTTQMLMLGLADGAPSKPNWIREARRTVADPMGRRYLTSNATMTTVVDVISGEQNDTDWCPGRVAVHAAALSPDGRSVALVCNSGSVVFGDALGDERDRMDTPWAGVTTGNALAFSPDARWLAIGSITGEVLLIDAEHRRVVAEDEGRMGPVREVAVRDDGLVAFSGDVGGPRLWWPQARAWVPRLPAADAGPLRFVGEGWELVSAGGRELKRWRLPERMPPRTFGHESGISGAVLHPRGYPLVASVGDGRFVIHDPRSGEHVGTVQWQKEVAKTGEFTPDGRYFIGFGGGEPGARVFDDAFEVVARLEGYRLKRTIALGDGVVFGLSYGPGLARWELGESPSGELPARTITYESPIFDAARSPQGEFGVVVDDVRGAVYRLSTGQAPQSRGEHLFDSPGAIAVDVSADGRTLALAHRDRVLLMTDAGEIRFEARRREGWYFDVELSPDERYLAAADRNGIAYVWRANDGALVARLRGHKRRLPWLSFDATGRLLLTSSWDGSVRLWATEAFERPADDLVREVEAGWGMALEDALGVTPR